MPAITRSVVLPHPVEAVWAALTDPDQLAVWLMPNDFRPEIGHHFTFRTDPGPGFDGVVQCQVVDIVPERRLAFTWVAGNVDTQVTFALTPEGTGTRLDLRHERFGMRQLPIWMLLAAGWKKILGRRLPGHLADRVAA